MLGPTRRVRRAPSVFGAAAFCLAALMLGACGDDGGSAADTTMDPNMDHSERMNMNMGDANATPAADAGGDLDSGTFEVLETRPPGLDNVAGTADLARRDDGTTVTVEFSGLKPQEPYIAHVHFGTCTEELGHYQFEEGGSIMPPNEIHLAFDADDDGAGFMTAENDGVVGDDGKSVVVHPKELMDNKIACADLT